MTDSQAKHRVLYAEDNTITAKLTRIAIEKAGFTVEIAPDGNQAWEAYLSRQPDILLLDLDIPGKTGWS